MGALVALGGLSAALALTSSSTQASLAAVPHQDASASREFRTFHPAVSGSRALFPARRPETQDKQTISKSTATHAAAPENETETQPKESSTPDKETNTQPEESWKDRSTVSHSSESRTSTEDQEKSTESPTWLPVTQAAAQPTDTIGSWLNQALGILKARGYPESEMNAEDIRAIISHESGGNPGAINLSDSNAAQGTPSKGLMQTIDPTFDKYALPGYTDIWNPVDNIIAGVRYAIASYGSISNVPGVVSMSDGGGYQGY
jgi:hypothetical protein